MNRLLAFFVIAVLSAFCACRGSQPDAVTTKQPTGHTFVDLLSAQLDAINYHPSVMQDGDVLIVRLGASSAHDVRRAICRAGGWPSGNRMIHLDDTLRRLHEEGVTRLRIASQSETLEVLLNQQGKCEKAAVESDEK